ncbi:TRAP transporter small permease [Virgibacillus oceani]
MSAIVKKTMRYLISLQKGIMILSAILILTGLVSTVILRYVFSTDLYGLEELIIIPAFWMYFIGASYGTYENKHISADITKVYIKSEKVKGYIKLFGTLISLIIALVFTYWSGLFIGWTVDSGATSTAWNYPLYIPQSAILFGFLLITLYTFLDLIKEFNYVKKLNK